MNEADLHFSTYKELQNYRVTKCCYKKKKAIWKEERNGKPQISKIDYRNRMIKKNELPPYIFSESDKLRK